MEERPMNKLPKDDHLLQQVVLAAEVESGSRSGMEQRAVLAEQCPLCEGLGVVDLIVDGWADEVDCPQCKGTAGENVADEATASDKLS